MLRRLLLGGSLVAMVPGSAFACGMYMPPERTKLLAEVLDEIDQQSAIEQNRQAMSGVHEAPAVSPRAEGPESTPVPVVPAPEAVEPAPTADAGSTAAVEGSG